MQFLVIAYDGTDDAAPARRQVVRANHIALGDTMRDAGTFLFGTAILNDNGQMIGSMMVMEFPDRAALDDWMAIEPYITGNVWDDVMVQSCRVGPTFTK